MEADLVKRMHIPFETIPAAGVHGVGLRSLPRNVSLLSRGVLASRRILREFKPDVLFFTGGFVAVPMAVAGIGIPTVLYVPDIEPGLALKVLARFAQRIAITADESRDYFTDPRRLIFTGYPTRPDLNRWTAQSGRQALGLSSDRPVLLVLGGSKGARSINLAVLDNLKEILKLAQLVHVSGSLDFPELERVRAQLPAHHARDYHLFPYLHEEMGAALACADLALSRAGASTLGEYPLFGLAAILVPYPYAWRYQKVNAEYLVKQGAAVLLEDQHLELQLMPVLKRLFGQPDRLQAMRSAMRRLSHPEAGTLIADQLLDLASRRKGTRD